jgi:hypothetical protein
VTIKSTCSKLSIMAGIIAAVIASNHNAFAETIKVKGSEAGTSVTVNFSFNGVTPANYSTFTGSDNIGGPFSAQQIADFSLDTGSGMAPDGSAGTVAVLIQSTEVDSYNPGQLYSTGVGAAAGSGCLSNTTVSFGLTVILSVTGGTGKFANASGSLTYTETGTILAAPGSPGSGLFGAFQATRTGAVTD